MTDQIRKARIEETRDEFKNEIKAAPDKKARYEIKKDKKSQALDTVTNIVVIHDKGIDVKYSIALNATAFKSDGKKITNEDPYLEELQLKFIVFLNGIKNDKLNSEL